MLFIFKKKKEKTFKRCKKKKKLNFTRRSCFKIIFHTKKGVFCSSESAIAIITNPEVRAESIFDDDNDDCDDCDCGDCDCDDDCDDCDCDCDDCDCDDDCDDCDCDDCDCDDDCF